MVPGFTRNRALLKLGPNYKVVEETAKICLFIQPCDKRLTYFITTHMAQTKEKEGRNWGD